MEQMLTGIKPPSTSKPNWPQASWKNIREKVTENYAKVAGHPYYHRLKIAVQVSSARNVYWITADGEEYSTYVQTGFTTAGGRSLAGKEVRNTSPHFRVLY